MHKAFLQCRCIVLYKTKFRQKSHLIKLSNGSLRLQFMSEKNIFFLLHIPFIELKGKQCNTCTFTRIIGKYFVSLLVSLCFWFLINTWKISHAVYKSSSLHSSCWSLPSDRAALRLRDMDYTSRLPPPTLVRENN